MPFKTTLAVARSAVDATLGDPVALLIDEAIAVDVFVVELFCVA